jgi:lauroyl/myristoyl acyltransferase
VGGVSEARIERQVGELSGAPGGQRVSSTREMRASARGRPESLTEVAARTRDMRSIELPPHKLVEAKDLYQIPLWIATKALYAGVPVPLLFRLFEAKGTVKWLVSKERGQVLSRMERFFGETKSEEELRHIARRRLEFTARRDLTKRWPHIQGFAGRETCEVEGMEHLDAALAAGRGAILATMHFGYGRLFKPLLESRGYTARGVGRTEASRAVPKRFTRVGLFVHSRLLRLRRTRHGSADLQAGINLRPLLAALSRNEILLLPLDNPGSHGLGRQGSLRPVPVLGKRILFSPGPLNLARRTATPLLPAFVVDSDDRGGIGIRLDILPPLELQRSDRPREDMDTNLERFAVVFEDYLRRYPYLFHCDSTETESLKVGEWVRVRGRPNDDGSFVAFTVKIRPSSESAWIIGPIDEIDKPQGVIRVLGRDVHIAAGCEVVDRARGRISHRELSVGDGVVVTGAYSGAGAFSSSSIHMSHKLDLQEQQELQGAVESVSVDGRSFEVLGFRVITTESTRIRDRRSRRPMTVGAGKPKRRHATWPRGV